MHVKDTAEAVVYIITDLIKTKMPISPKIKTNKIKPVKYWLYFVGRETTFLFIL